MWSLVAAEAARVLGAPGPVPSASLIEQFNEALCAVAFDKGNIAKQQGVVSRRQVFDDDWTMFGTPSVTAEYQQLSVNTQRAAHTALPQHRRPGKNTAIIPGCSLHSAGLLMQASSAG
jgi:hypothetical protein